MPPIVIPRTVVNRILTHAQGTPEQEVCGLIAARGDIPDRVYPVANAAGEPRSRFAMEPRAQIEAMRQMREAGEELFAIYHSHPHAAAEPSATDLAEAAYPEALYLVISLNTTGVLEMRGFRLAHGKAEAIELEVA